MVKWHLQKPRVLSPFRSIRMRLDCEMHAYGMKWTWYPWLVKMHVNEIKWAELHLF